MSVDIDSRNQEFFRAMVLGTLLYSVVLGFFNDYTGILHTRSYSITFSLAITLQVLTYLTFYLKDLVKDYFKPKDSLVSRIGLVFSIWLVLFLSKFVFLAVISAIFRDEVYVSGFIGLMLIIISLTVFQAATQLFYRRLGERDK